MCPLCRRMIYLRRKTFNRLSAPSQEKTKMKKSFWYIKFKYLLENQMFLYA